MQNETFHILFITQNTTMVVSRILFGDLYPAESAFSLPLPIWLGSQHKNTVIIWQKGARCSSVVRAFARGAMGRWIDPSWWTH